MSCVLGMGGCKRVRFYYFIMGDVTLFQHIVQQLAFGSFEAWVFACMIIDDTHMLLSGSLIHLLSSQMKLLITGSCADQLVECLTPDYDITAFCFNCHCSNEQLA